MHDKYHSIFTNTVPGYDAATFEYIGQGEDNIAFEVDCTLIVRFTKHDADALRREAAILDFARMVSPLPTPVVRYNHADKGFIAYEKLPGEPLIRLIRKVDVSAWPDFCTQLGNFMRAVNRADVSSMQKVLPVDMERLEVWLQESKQFFEHVAHLIQSKYHKPIQDFLATQPPQDAIMPVFAHNDLGIEHILVDADTQRITGIIDWGDATLADPAYDFGKIYRDLGPEVFGRVLDAYQARDDHNLTDRAVFYAKCGVLEDLEYGLQQQDQLYIDKGKTSLAWLFA